MERYDHSSISPQERYDHSSRAVRSFLKRAVRSFPGGTIVPNGWYDRSQKHGTIVPVRSFPGTVSLYTIHTVHLHQGSRRSVPRLDYKASTQRIVCAGVRPGSWHHFSRCMTSGRMETVRSWSVLLYISDCYSERIKKDYMVASKLSRYV